jgi:hypothetical protein
MVKGPGGTRSMSAGAGAGADVDADAGGGAAADAGAGEGAGEGAGAGAGASVGPVDVAAVGGTSALPHASSSSRGGHTVRRFIEAREERIRRVRRSGQRVVETDALR